MPFLTTLEDARTKYHHVILLQRRLRRGDLLQGIGTVYIVRRVEYVATRGRDFSVVGHSSSQTLI